MVHDYWVERRGWKLDRIGGLLPQVSLLKLASTIINTSRSEPDKMGRLDPSSGVFSMKPACDSKLGDLKKESGREES